MKSNIRVSRLSVAAVVAAVVAGCSTIERPPVYESELDRAAVTTAIEPQDIRRTIEKMAESLIADAGVVEATGGKRPVLDIEPMKNRTSSSIDMRSITDSIRMRLVRSRLFRFVDRSTAGADIAIMDEQAQLGLVDSRKRIRSGKQLAAQMYLSGTLTDMVGQAGGTTDHYYKFSMTLKDLSSGEIVWANEQEIRKVLTDTDR